MKLIEARVNGSPRQVSTKYGDKSVLDVSTSEGEFTIWRPAGDLEVMGRTNGERVKVAIDSKGKVWLVEHCSTAPQQRLAPVGKPDAKSGCNRAEVSSACVAPSSETRQAVQMGFTTETPETTRSAEIADYIQRLGTLYGHCLNTAKKIPATGILEAPEIKDVATTLFIQTVRHFDL